MRSRIRILIAVSLCSFASLTAQVPTLVSLVGNERLDGGETGQQFGASVDFAGDVNGDGAPDLVIGAPASVASSTPMGAGVAYVVDAATGAVILNLSGSSVGSMMGERVAGIGDVDSDGRDDLLILRRGPPAPLGGRVVEVISGLTGSVLRQHVGNAGERLGQVLRGLPDLDGDGVPDYAIGVPGAAAGFTLIRAGKVFVHSGASGNQLHEWTGAAVGESLGESIAAAGDVDGDGVTDILIGGGGDQVFDLSGQVELRSGAGGGLLLRLDAAIPQDGFGRSLAGLGDFNGDGIADFAVGAPGIGVGPVPPSSRLEIRSLIGGTLLLTVDGAGLPGPARRPGSAVAPLGDVDQDGFADVAVCFRGSAGAVDEIRVLHGPAAEPGRRLPIGGLGCGSADRLVAGVDLDGDGVSELLASDPLGSAATNGAGSVWIHHVLAPDPCAAGNAGGDLLGVATTTRFSTGGRGRTVDLSLLEPFVGIVLARPPAALQPSDFVVFGALQSEVFTPGVPLVPGLAPLCFPVALLGLNPGAPGFVLAETTGLLPGFLPAQPASLPAPGGVVASFSPPAMPFTLTLQAVIVDPAAPALGVSVTNALEVSFR